MSGWTRASGPPPKHRRRAEAAEVPAGTSAGVAGEAPAGNISIEFADDASGRSLESWDHPVIPDEIRDEGARKYTVVIDFLVDDEGFTSGYSIRTTSGKAVIDAAVQVALRSWVFREASVKGSGKKIPATLTYVIEIK